MWYLLEIAVFTVLLIFDLSSKEAVVVFLKQQPFNYYDLIDGVLALNYSENTGAGMSKTYSARGCGWLRLRGSMATKTTKSGTMLKAEIGRGQLVCASDKPPANFNA